MAKKAAEEDSLKRLGGGRWQTRDERFTIEPESGTWVVLDAEQTDDLGLPLVRGPFGSLTAAKAAIAGARGSEPVVSPLAAKVAEHQGRPVTPAKALKPHVIEVVKAGTTLGTPAKPPAPSKPPVAKAKPPEPVEPKWILDLGPAGRRRAYELIERLAQAGVPDPESIAEREIAADEPAVATYALARAIERLGPEAAPAAVARLLAAGEAPDLDVRWRLVDGDGRPIPFKEVLR